VVLRLVGLAMILILGAIAVLGLPSLPTTARQRFSIWWSRTILAVLGVRVAGPPGTRWKGLLVANHVSWIDVVAINAVAPARPLAKREVEQWPVVGRLARGGGSLFVDRDRLRELPDVVADVASVLRAGDPVLVFPEATTWCGVRTGPFRAAMFQAAIDAGAPVQPVALRYGVAGRTSTAASFVGEDSLLTSILRVARTRGLTVDITAAPPLPAQVPLGRRAHARRALAQAARAAICGAELPENDHALAGQPAATADANRRRSAWAAAR
jgi:1-acyl-sn-glycerol-3-phosphate acyltransferase